jgi:hypothetical protein
MNFKLTIYDVFFCRWNGISYETVVGVGRYRHFVDQIVQRVNAGGSSARMQQYSQMSANSNISDSGTFKSITVRKNQFHVSTHKGEVMLWIACTRRSAILKLYDNKKVQFESDRCK